MTTMTMMDRFTKLPASWQLAHVAAGLIGLCVLARGKARGPGGYLRAVRWFPGQILSILKVLTTQDMGALVRQGRKDYGDIYWSKMGSKSLLVLNHPDDWADVMRQETKLKLYPDLPDSTRRIHGQGSLQDLAGGSPKHQLYRKIFSALLTPKALESFAPILVDRFGQLWKKLEQLSCESKDPIMIRAHVRDTQFELMCKVLYGIDKENGPDDVKALEQMRVDFESEENGLFAPEISSTYKEGLVSSQRNKAYLRQKFLRHLEAMKETTEKVDSVVGSAMEAVAQAVIKNNLQDDQETLEDIVTNLNFLLEASHGTSIYITTSMLYFLHLPENKQALDKLRNEVANMQKEPIDNLYLALKNDMPLADGCINETLRLAPIVEAIIYSADATQTVKIRKQTIPCPNGILVALAAPAQDAAFFEQPQEFRPQRWVAGDPLECPDKSKLALRMMGIGRHVCLGQSLAKLALKAALFSYASEPTRTIQFDPSVSYIKKNINFPNSVVSDGLMGRVVRV